MVLGVDKRLFFCVTGVDEVWRSGLPKQEKAGQSSNGVVGEISFTHSQPLRFFRYSATTFTEIVAATPVIKETFAECLPRFFTCLINLIL